MVDEKVYTLHTTSCSIDRSLSKFDLYKTNGTIPDRHIPTCSLLRIIAVIITSLAFVLFILRGNEKNQRLFVGSTWRTSTSYSPLFAILIFSLSPVFPFALSIRRLIYSLLYLLSSVLSFPRFSLHSSMKRNNLRISSYTWKKRKLNEIKPRNATNTIHRANLFIYSENCSRTKRKRFIFFFFSFFA